MQILLNEENRQNIIDKAVNALKKGNMVVYPSDTVYGIAADGTSQEATRKLDELKKRPGGQKYSFNFSSIEMVKNYCDLTPSQEKILRKYLPGPYTFVLSPEIAVRIPKDSIITDITEAFGKPTTATSANISGREPAVSIKTLDAKIYLAADLLIEHSDFKPTHISTIVDISGDEPKIIRKGGLPFPV